MTSAIEIVRASPHFSVDEWPGGVLEKMTPGIVSLLTDARATSGVPAFPSPVERAHVRSEWSKSRHSLCEGQRLSDATDIFLRWRDVLVFAKEVWDHPLRGGVGIYADMIFRGASPGAWAMLHLDTRPDPLDWAAWRESPDASIQYAYEINNPQEYRDVLAARTPLDVARL